jgi:hypothetical protein
LTRKTSLKQEEILLRRSKVIELRARGLSERKMSEQLGIPRSTLHADLRVLKRQAAMNIQIYVEHDLPHEAELLLINTNALLGIAWASLEKELQGGRPPYPAIASIISILNLKQTLIGDKLETAIFFKDNVETKHIDLEEQAMREAYERERHRREAIF